MCLDFEMNYNFKIWRRRKTVLGGNSKTRYKLLTELLVQKRTIADNSYIVLCFIISVSDSNNLSIVTY